MMAPQAASTIGTQNGYRAAKLARHTTQAVTVSASRAQRGPVLPPGWRPVDTPEIE